jgi:hypothetical protein
MRASDYGVLGGYVDEIKQVEDVNAQITRKVPLSQNDHNPMRASNYNWSGNTKTPGSKT